MKKNIITISREYGSGGYEIGQRVAEALGFKFYDKDLLAKIAEHSMISVSFMEATEKKHLKRNLFTEIFPIFANSEVEQANYIFSEQGRFIEKLAEEGNFVIAGRRADYYLRNHENAMHLFFYADMDFRIDRICKKDNCTPDEAAKRIETMDKQRRTSYEYTTGRTWADRHNYDRMICTSTYGIDKCVDEIIALMKMGMETK